MHQPSTLRGCDLSMYFYIRWVGVGWRRRNKTCPSLRELDSQGTVLFSFFVWRPPKLAVELIILVRGGEP